MELRVIEIPPPLRDDAWWLEHYLGLWASWMRSNDDLPEGCPEEASGGLTPYLSLDFDGMCERMDSEHAQQTHMAIWRLSPTERNAIYRERGIIAFVELRDFEGTLRKAKEALRRELLQMGLWFGA